jgi:chromosome segregation ATPase
MARLQIEIDAQYTGGAAVKAAGADIGGMGESAERTALQLGALKAQEADLAKKTNELAAAVAKGEKSFDQAEKELKSYKDAMQKLPQPIDEANTKTNLLSSTIGKLATGAVLAAAGKALLDFGKASLMAASDVQEMQSKFNVVFKDLAGDVTAELQDFADAANRSIFDLQGFAATLQDTFVPLGFARDSAADMSIQLVKLAEDLASFNNLNTADVVNDLQSALVGNTETLRKYGVVATQAAIDEKALAMGLEFTKGKMDAETKALAILQIALDSTTDAQGDAINTADSYANTTKGLDAAMMDLKVAIGEGLVPVMTKLATVATGVVKGVTGTLNVIDALEAAVKDGTITNEEYAEHLRAVGRRTMDAGEVMAFLTKRTQEQTMASKEMGTSLSAVNAEMGAWEARMARVNPALVANVQAAREFADQYEMNAALAADNAQENERLAVSHEDIAAAEERRITIAAELAEKEREMAAASGDIFAATVKAEGAMGFFNETAKEMADGFVTVGGRTAEQNAELGRLSGNLEDVQGKYDKAAQTLSDYERGLIGVGLPQEELNAKMDEQREIMTNAQAAMSPYIGAIGELSTVTGEATERAGSMTVNQDAVNQALFEAADASGASAEQLAILGGALGIYSEEAMEAALQTALIQAKIDELAQAYVSGAIGVDEMRIELRNFTNDLGSTIGAAGELTGAIDGIPRDISIHIGWNADPVPNLPSGIGAGGTGTPSGEVAMQSGGIVPGMFSQAVPIVAHGSEMILNPSQQQTLFSMLNGGGMGQGLVIQIFNQGVKGENVTANTQQGVLNAMRQVGQY